MMMNNKKKLYKVRAINTECGRVDYHHNLTRWDLEWLRAIPTLKIEILEVESVERDSVQIRGDWEEDED